MNKILVIDDQQFKLDDIINQLNSHFVTIDSAMNFITSRKKINSNNYDLILLDITMNDPISRNEFVGLDILSHIQNLNITTPVIVVTQFYNFNDLSLSKEKNGFLMFNDYYGKEVEYNFSAKEDIHFLPIMHKYLSQSYKNYYGCVLYVQNDSTWIDNLKKMLFKLGGKQYENFITR